MKRGTLAGVALLTALLASGCASAAEPVSLTVVEPSTTRIEGWLSSRGELTVFPRRLTAAYDPYPQDERARCVSLIDGTGLEPAALERLHGRRVVVTGTAVRWDSLREGTDRRDQLLGKRYHGETEVPNGCVRENVFLATTVTAAP